MWLSKLCFMSVFRPTIFIVTFTLIAFSRIQPIYAQNTFFTGCKTPLILYTEFIPENTYSLHCLTENGDRNLGVNGWAFALSPDKQWIVYSRSHGPYRTVGKEFFGYTSLFIYDIAAKKESLLLAEMGKINYFWIGDTNKLMISFWINRLGAYEDEYPAHFIYDPSVDRFTEMKWPNGRILGYLPQEEKFVITPNSAGPTIFAVAASDIGTSQPLDLSKTLHTFTLAISPSGAYLAYKNYGAANQTIILNQITHEKILFSSASIKANTTDVEIIGFSRSNKYLALTLDKYTVVIYSLEERSNVFIQEDSPQSGYFQFQWLNDADTLLIFKPRSEDEPLFTDIFEIDMSTKSFSRLTNTATAKSP